MEVFGEFCRGEIRQIPGAGNSGNPGSPWLRNLAESVRIMTGKVLLPTSPASWHSRPTVLFGPGDEIMRAHLFRIPIFITSANRSGSERIPIGQVFFPRETERGW